MSPSAGNRHVEASVATPTRVGAESTAALSTPPLDSASLELAERQQTSVSTPAQRTAIVFRVVDERGAPIDGVEIERREPGRTGGPWSLTPGASTAIEQGEAVLTVERSALEDREFRIGAPRFTWQTFAAHSHPTDDARVTLLTAGEIVATFKGLAPEERWTIFVERNERSPTAGLRDARRDARGNDDDFRRQALTSDRAIIERLPPGDYRVSAARTGETKSRVGADVHVAAGEASTVTLELPRVEPAPTGGLLVRVVGSELAELSRDFRLRLELLEVAREDAPRRATPVEQARVPPLAVSNWEHRFARAAVGEYAVVLHPLGLRARATVVASETVELVLDADGLARTAVNLYSEEDGRALTPRRVTATLRTSAGYELLEPATARDGRTQHLFVSPVGDLTVKCDDEGFAIAPSWTALNAGWNTIDLCALASARVSLHASPSLLQSGADPWEGVEVHDASGQAIKLGRTITLASAKDVGDLEIVVPARTDVVVSWAPRAGCTPPALRLRLEPGSVARREVSCADGG